MFYKKFKTQCGKNIEFHIEIHRIQGGTFAITSNFGTDSGNFYNQRDLSSKGLFEGIGARLSRYGDYKSVEQAKACIDAFINNIVAGETAYNKKEVEMNAQLQSLNAVKRWRLPRVLKFEDGDLVLCLPNKTHCSWCHYWQILEGFNIEIPQFIKDQVYNELGNSIEFPSTNCTGTQFQQYVREFRTKVETFVNRCLELQALDPIDKEKFNSHYEG